MSQATADEDSGPLPRRFGDYTLVALLGRGGMGEVFLAMRGGIEGIARRCVVKTLRPAFTEDREYVARFLDEARVVVQLHHRNICPVFDVGRVDGRYFLAMEYIAGRDLRSVVDVLRTAGRPLHRDGGVGLALHMVAEVLEALEHAHTLADPGTGDPLHLVHRDVSPHNVMIGFDGDVRLIDFGLAASTLKAEHTAPNVVMGKVAYMSPEQICGDPLDAAADQFSATIMAVELLTGERFYGGMSNRELYAHAARGGYRPPAFARLPAGLRAILDRGLSTERQQRFPSCAAMRAALDAWRYEQGVRGDGPTLRAVMREVFADDIVAERQLLAAAASAAGLPADGLTTRPVASAAPPSDTVRQPRAAIDDDVGATVSAASAPAAFAALPPTMAAPTGPRRWPRVVAAGLVAATLAVGLMVAVDRDATAPTPVAPPALAPSPTTTATTTATPAMATTTATPVMATTTATPVTPGPASLHTAAPSTPPSAPRPRPSPTAAPTTAPAIRGIRDAPPPALRVGARLLWLKRNCPALACARPLLAQETTWVGLEPGAVSGFKARVHACVDECQALPR